MTKAELLQKIASASVVIERDHALYFIGGLVSPGPNPHAYKPNRGILQAYERQQKADIFSLYKGRPYESPELGYSPEEIESSFGQRGAEFQAARQGEQQTIEDAYRRIGGRHLTGSRFKARQGVRQADVARRGENRRSMLLADAAQRRADWARRHGHLTGAYQHGTGTYNEAEQIRLAAESARAAGRARSIDKLVSFAVTGGASALMPGQGGE